MTYYFRAGRSKNIVIDGEESFLGLGYAILRAYHIDCDHCFMFTFENGEETNSGTPFGAMDDYRDVNIDMRIAGRHMRVGETMKMEYDYAGDWSRKVTLVEINP